jgi:putative SOS response-associated peptidase YedK
MCGLYSFRKTAEETRSLLQYLEELEFPPPRSYVAPQRPIAIVRLENNEGHFAPVRWGFIPSWVKEIKPGKPLINARSETLLEKPSFRIGAAAASSPPMAVRNGWVMWRPRRSRTSSTVLITVSLPSPMAQSSAVRAKVPARIPVASGQFA